MLKKLVILVGFLAFINHVSVAQLKRADYYYENHQYKKAIQLYSKALKKEERLGTVKKLADCYFGIKDYENAEIYYAKAAGYDNIGPDVALNYGKVLKINSKLDDAKKVFLVYAAKHPKDKNGKQYLLAIDEIRLWSKDPPKFNVSNIAELNTEVADFSPTPYNGGLIFVSERNTDHVSGKQYQFNERPYLSVYYAERNAENYKKPKPFDNVLNTEYHNGPVTFNGEKNEAFFTRVEVVRKKDRTFVNRPQLYISELEKKKWRKAIPFEHNNENYSLAHPALSPDGKQLYLVSDMPGGFGGKDIYICEKNGDSWGKPFNLGDKINTSGDEMFPYLHPNGTLYFSSDGHIGYGELDIFMASRDKDGSWKEIENLRAPLNSATDDFGITFEDGTTGYFSSNRPGGIGDDDIYEFRMLEIPKRKTIVSGIFMYSKLRPGSNAMIKLLDANNNELMRTTTNARGEFNFQNLDPDMAYIILVDENDTKLTGQSSIYITNDSGGRIIQMERNGKRFFKFTALDKDQYDSMPLLPATDESLLTINLFGKIYKKLPGDYSEEVQVHIVDDAGRILYTALTDENGNFKFEKLPPDQNYLFKVIDPAGNVKLLILNEKGDLVEAVKPSSSGVYNYIRLDPDETIITLLDERDVMIKIRPEDNFVISNIYYDYDSWEIKDVAAGELDKLVLILQKNPHIGVELSSNTDSRASDKYNLELSEKRAQAAVEYIVSKNISPDRMTGKGYGETRLVNHCANDVECSEEEHARNRRTEIRIIKKN